MSELSMSAKQAESDLLELIRLQDSLNFTITITHDGDGWTVSFCDHDIPSLATGQGASFARAWFGQRPVRT